VVIELGKLKKEMGKLKEERVKGSSEESSRRWGGLGWPADEEVGR